MPYIIVKYKSQYAGGKAFVSASVVHTFSAKRCGVDQTVYPSEEAAQPDLQKLQDFNPSVDYGIVETYTDD